MRNVKIIDSLYWVLASVACWSIFRLISTLGHVNTERFVKIILN